MVALSTNAILNFVFRASRPQARVTIRKYNYLKIQKSYVRELSFVI